MRFGSVCSGIEAASVAWEPLGWRAAWFAEIEAFPSAVLRHHYPETPNLGDMSVLAQHMRLGLIEAPPLLVGGTPCQAFSVAGLRNSLADARGNLSLIYIDLLDAIDHARAERNEPAAVCVWENVPGVLSAKDNAFGCFLAGLAGETVPLEPAGPRWTNAGLVLGPSRTVAWRVLDAQYFGLAQRRRRVFVVASARDDFDPAAVLFECEGVRRDTPPRRETGQGITHDVAPSAGESGEIRGQAPVVTGFRMVAFGEYAEDDTASTMKQRDYKDATDLVAFNYNAQACQLPVEGGSRDLSIADSLTCSQGVAVAIGAFKGGQGSSAGGIGFDEHVSPTLSAADSGSNRTPALLHGMQVRRLTPTECERLQGFPDGYTLTPYRGKPACDGPRYKALGNSMAVPVMRWLGERIANA